MVRVIQENEEEGREISLCAVERKSRRMAINFQVADVKRPLMAVKRMTETGNKVVFGPKEKDCYIENLESGERLRMYEKGHGSYALKVNFVGKGQTEITVDSAAEESVCPSKWADQFGMVNADEWMKFSGANGNRIRHYGQRLVQVESPDVESTF